MDKRDSGGFFSRRLVCRTSDSSYDSTDSSLVETTSWLSVTFLFVDKLLTRHTQRAYMIKAVHVCTLVSADHKFYIIIANAL